MEFTRKEQIQDIIALRNQLLSEVKKSVCYNEATGVVKMEKKHYDALVKNFEDITEKYKRKL